MIQLNFSQLGHPGYCVRLIQSREDGDGDVRLVVVGVGRERDSGGRSNICHGTYDFN